MKKKTKQKNFSLKQTSHLMGGGGIRTPQTLPLDPPLNRPFSIDPGPECDYSLNMTDDPTNHLPLRDTRANTLGLDMFFFFFPSSVKTLGFNVFFFLRQLNQSFAWVITALAWLSLPFRPLEPSAMSLNWNFKKSKEGSLFYQWVQCSCSNYE